MWAILIGVVVIIIIIIIGKFDQNGIAPGFGMDSVNLLTGTV